MEYSLEIDSDADAAYIRLSRASVRASEEVADGLVVDVDAQGEIVGIEVVGLRRRVGAGDTRSYLQGLAEGLTARPVEVPAQ